ncbi:Antitoxin (DNA-binding domain) of toxin-antitoxin stability system [Halanaeroarchaeum sp. HSR-CO]|nr:Antitoxin (DNA-binding domain) of toxin-antitoxin stability system [Halanaeroarchaeum sp. HSR-CO]
MSIDSDAGGDGEMDKLTSEYRRRCCHKLTRSGRNGATRTSPSSFETPFETPSIPPTQLSEEALEHLAESREQREQGETVSQDDVKDRLGIDD